MNRTVYVLRIKPGLRDMVPQALASDELIIGWTDVPQLLDPSLTKDDFRTALSRSYYPSAKTLGKAGSAAGNMWRFLREMSVGDIVLVPHKKNFYAAEVIGAPSHDPTVEEGGFRRPVRWLNDKRPFTRASQPEVYKLLLERKTCYVVSLTNRTDALPFFTQVVAESDMADDLADLAGRADIDPTTRRALVNARIGQGKFREDLLVAWNRACAVTGCTEANAIRASHAKRWADSTDLERLDCNNGLPLVGTLDALFDAGLIAFSDAGEMLVSKLLSIENCAILGLPLDLRRAPSSLQAMYLRHHRENQFR